MVQVFLLLSPYLSLILVPDTRLCTASLWRIWEQTLNGRALLRRFHPGVSSFRLSLLKSHMKRKHALHPLKMSLNLLTLETMYLLSVHKEGNKLHFQNVWNSNAEREISCFKLIKKHGLGHHSMTAHFAERVVLCLGNEQVLSQFDISVGLYLSG